MSHSDTIVTLVFSDGSMSQGSRFDSYLFGLSMARHWSHNPDVVASIAATGQQGAVCYSHGENISLSEVIRIQNGLFSAV